MLKFQDSKLSQICIVKHTRVVVFNSLQLGTGNQFQKIYLNQEININNYTNNIKMR